MGFLQVYGVAALVIMGFMTIIWITSLALKNSSVAKPHRGRRAHRSGVCASGRGHTLLYLRFYQRFMRLPVLRDLVTWAAMPGNVVVAHQDRRVVVTHQPQPSGLRIGEKLIQGDRPIIEYRRRRQELIEKADTREPTHA